MFCRGKVLPVCTSHSLLFRSSLSLSVHPPTFSLPLSLVQSLISQLLQASEKSSLNIPSEIVSSYHTVAYNYLKPSTMDPVKMEKLQAMRRYRSMQNRFLINLVQYCLSLLCFGLFLSSPLWLPKLCAALRHYVVVSIPGMGMYLFCPKCFFVLGNVIVIFLVGESKLSGAAASTPDIYDEYMERSKTHQRTSPSVEKDKDAEVQRPACEENARKSGGLKEDEVKVDEEEEVVVEEEEDEEEEEEGEGEEGVDGWEEEDRGVECYDGDDDNALPADELNRRIEDFIARVNKQRRLELLDCSG